MISLLVIIPTNFFVTSSITNRPDTLSSCISLDASDAVLEGEIVYGCSIITDSDLFTLNISSTCSEIVINLWIIPIPPSFAIAIAMLDSVTVSIFALIRGIFNEMFLDNFVFKSV